MDRAFPLLLYMSLKSCCCYLSWTCRSFFLDIFIYHSIYMMSFQFSLIPLSYYSLFYKCCLLIYFVDMLLNRRGILAKTVLHLLSNDDFHQKFPM